MVWDGRAATASPLGSGSPRKLPGPLWIRKEGILRERPGNRVRRVQPTADHGRFLRSAGKGRELNNQRLDPLKYLAPTAIILRRLPSKITTVALLSRKQDKPRACVFVLSLSARPHRCLCLPFFVCCRRRVSPLQLQPPPPFAMEPTKPSEVLASDFPPCY